MVASKIATTFIQSMMGFGSEGEFWRVGGSREISGCFKPAPQLFVGILYNSQSCWLDSLWAVLVPKPFDRARDEREWVREYNTTQRNPTENNTT